MTSPTYSTPQQAARMAAFPRYSPRMPEDHYSRELALIAAEQRAYRKAKATHTHADCEAWKRASERLTAHENAFS